MCVYVDIDSDKINTMDSPAIFYLMIKSLLINTMDFFVVSTKFDEISYYKYNRVPLTLLIYSLSD